MRYSVEPRSTVYGKPITGLEGMGEGKVKQKTGRRGGDIPFGISQITWYPAVSQGP
jgi:hypothetical protein